MASGAVGGEQLSRLLAASLDLPFVESSDPRRLMPGEERLDVVLRGNRPGAPVRLAGRRGEPASLLVSPKGWSPAALAALLGRSPGLRDRLAVTSPPVLRRALVERASSTLLRNAVAGLADAHPLMSARQTLHGWQGVAAGALLALLPLSFLLAPHAALLVLHLVASLFFLACVVLRLRAVRAAPPYRLAPPPELGQEVPVYSVLVALYREAAVVPQLVEALEAIDWPAGRLEIKLVCEADDHDTLQAIRAARLSPLFEVVEVPPSHPRTKPKALNYALPLTRGTFVVLYDAEDRPDPLQLREAWGRFEKGGPQLACLQAPLVIANDRASWPARLFAVEYAALFRGLLPYLSERNLVLPLGGTSNHFRRSALVAAGGWDPFNVTEDADLGLRLSRLGYCTGTLSRPTFEDAPETIGAWLPQRTRWFKGWTQTLLVHMREPARLFRELGPRSFLIAQVLLAGMIVSALVHPLLFATLVALLCQALADGLDGDGMRLVFLLDWINVLGGYCAFLALSFRSMSKRERRGFWKVVVATPFYWLLLSIAAWNALWQLWRRPHHWAKSNHQPARATVIPLPDSGRPHR